MKYIFLIPIFGLLSCSQSAEKKAETFEISADKNCITLTDVQMKNTGIQTFSIENKDISATILLNGSVEAPPRNLASVLAPSGGYVRSAKFMVGNAVRAGETLVVLEDPSIVQLQQDYLLAKSNANYAQ